MGKRKGKKEGLHVTPVDRDELSEEAREFIESFEDRAAMAIVERVAETLCTAPGVHAPDVRTAMRIAADIVISYYRETRKHADRTIKRDKKRRDGHNEYIIGRDEKAAEFMKNFRAEMAKGSTSGKRPKITRAVEAAAKQTDGVGISTGWKILKKIRSKVL